MKTHQPTATQSAFIHPDPSPLAPAVPETCDIPGQSETFTDTPTPNTHLASPPSSPRLRPMPDTPLETREERVESETCVPPSRAVLCPDTRRETPNPEKRPDKIESPGISSPHPPSSIPDTLPSKICDNTGQCETSAASPAHRPASNSQLLTPNSQLRASTPPPRRTCDNTGQSETFADKPNPNTPASPAHLPPSDFQLLTSNSQLLPSTPRPAEHVTIRDKVRRSPTHRVAIPTNPAQPQEHPQRPMPPPPAAKHTPPPHSPKQRRTAGPRGNSH